MLAAVAVLFLTVISCRVAEVLRRHPPDLGGHRGREHRDVLLLRGVGEDRLDVLGEAHVEHLVGLIEHQEPQLGQVEGALLEVVHDPAGSADDDVDAATQGAEAARRTPGRRTRGARARPGGARRTSRRPRRPAPRARGWARAPAPAGTSGCGRGGRGSAARRPRSCRCRSARGRRRRGRRAASGWSRPGSATASRSPTSRSALSTRSSSPRSAKVISGVSDSAGASGMASTVGVRAAGRGFVVAATSVTRVAISPTSRRHFLPPRLLDGDRLGEVAGLVDVVAEVEGGVVGEDLERDGEEDRVEAPSSLRGTSIRVAASPPRSTSGWVTTTRGPPRAAISWRAPTLRSVSRRRGRSRPSAPRARSGRAGRA